MDADEKPAKAAKDTEKTLKRVRVFANSPTKASTTLFYNYYHGIESVPIDRDY